MSNVCVEVMNLDDFLANPKKVKSFELDNASEYGDDVVEVKDGKILEGSNGIIAVLIKHKNENILILNADEGENSSLVSECEGYGFPTLSFACLSKFFNQTKHDSSTNIAKIANLLTTKRFKLVDFSEEESRPMNNALSQKYQKWSNSGQKGKCPINIPRGFTVVGNRFHKSSGVLLKDTNKTGRSMIFGVDESQYFGCELPTHPTTLNQAFKELIPKEIRNRTDLSRQGEWFFVPIKKSEYPSREKFEFTSEGNFYLPVDDLESNVHEIYASEGGISKGIIYAIDPTVKHDQHEELDLPGYFKILKNTAIRSVSQEGVD